MRPVSIQEHDIIFSGNKMLTLIIESQFSFDYEKENGMPAAGLFDVVFMIAQEGAAADHIYIVVSEEF